MTVNSEQFEQAALDARPLFSPGEVTPLLGLNITEKATLDNITNALTATEIPTENFTHKASGKVFVIGPMSSEGYTALQFVEEFNPMGYKISSLAQDELERKAIYLVFGVQEPKIDKATAKKILKAKGWGPSNNELINSIKLLNPDPQEVLSNVRIMEAFCRFITLFMIIEEKTGELTSRMDKMKLNKKVRNTLEYSLDLFSKLFGTQETASEWKIALDETLQEEPEEGG